MRYHFGSALKRLSSPLLCLFLLTALSVLPALAQDNEVDPKEHFDKALKLSDSKEYAKALDELNIARKATPKEEKSSYLTILKWIGYVAVQAGRYNDALEPLQTLTSETKDDFEALLNLANAYEGLKKDDEAIATYKKVIAINDKLPDPYFNIGNLYFHQKQYPQAITNLKKAGVLNPKDPAVFQNLGHALMMQKSFAEAAEAYGHATKNDPTNSKLFLYQGNASLLQMRKGDNIADAKTNCKNAYASALKLNAKSLDVRLRYGEALMDMKEYEEAITQFRAATNLDANRYEGHYNLAQALAAQQKEEKKSDPDSSIAKETLKEFKKAVELASKAEEIRDALLGQGLFEAARKQYPEAEKTFARLTSEYPQYTDAWVNLGFIRLKQDPPNHDGAIEAGEAGLKKVTEKAGQAKIQRMLGAVYTAKATTNLTIGSTKRAQIAFLDKAQLAFKEAIAANPNDAEALHGIGLAASWAGKLDEAVDYLKRAIEIRKGYAEAHNDLGVAYTLKFNSDRTRKEYIQLAFESLKKAAKYDPLYKENLTAFKKETGL